MTDKAENPEHVFMPCSRCGQTISLMSIIKRKERNRPDLDVCKDCRDVATYQETERRKVKKWRHPVLGMIDCVIFEGELNDDWLPVDDEGQLFRPGTRICGLKDCVKTMHVIPPEVKTISETDRIIGLHEIQQYNKRARANR